VDLDEILYSGDDIECDSFQNGGRLKFCGWFKFEAIGGFGWNFVGM
jgi:hypothetical protein